MEQRRMEGFPLTANRIQLIALSHFAKYGYAGTSLSKIAEEVGIKKPSIYAHYKSKEDLFLHVLQSVFVDELNWITDFFHKHEQLPLYDQLKLLLDSYRHRYSQYDVLKFMLRVAFFPPPSLQEPVLERMHSFIERLEKGLIPRMAQALRSQEIHGVHPEQAAKAFISILDGLFVQLLYGGVSRFESNLEAAWTIYWRGITCKSV